MKSVYILLAAAFLLASPLFADEYKVGPGIGKGNYLQLAVDPSDALCALTADGKITVFNEDGTIAQTIDTQIANAASFAFEADGTLNVFSEITKTRKVKSGAKLVEMQVSVGVERTRFDASGTKLSSAKIEGVKSVKKAFFVAGKLILADLSNRAVVIIDSATGQEVGRISKGLRLCCGIFDCCEAPNNTIAVSNLGAFKLQQFTLAGKLIMEFGRRGRKLENFHGCCNPVSAAFLPNGEILTVEKDPTRIKIYDAKGESARQIEGVEELVKGCSYIPVTVNRKGTIFLASSTKQCIVQCIPESKEN